MLCLDKKNRVEIQDFKDWKAGVYLIEAGCGMGKNYFVFNTLFPYARVTARRTKCVQKGTIWGTITYLLKRTEKAGNLLFLNIHCDIHECS